jgi:hypothetical protein
MDANTLLYLRARYYSPALGVFTALDPVENLNRYQYVGGNPTNLVDSSGMFAEPIGRWNPCWQQTSDPCSDCMRRWISENVRDDGVGDIWGAYYYAAWLACRDKYVCPSTYGTPITSEWAWGMPITPNDIMPPITGNYGTCSHQNLVSERAACAVEQYNNLTEFGTNPLTWAQFVSLTLYGEVGTTVLADPEGFSCCARLTKADPDFVCGAQSASVLTQVLVQAAVQWLLGNQAEGCGGTGTCTEEQVVRWMTSIQVWFTYVNSPMNNSARN